MKNKLATKRRRIRVAKIKQQMKETLLPRDFDAAAWSARAADHHEEANSLYLKESSDSPAESVGGIRIN